MQNSFPTYCWNSCRMCCGLSSLQARGLEAHTWIPQIFSKRGRSCGSQVSLSPRAQFGAPRRAWAMSEWKCHWHLAVCIILLFIYLALCCWTKTLCHAWTGNVDDPSPRSVKEKPYQEIPYALSRTHSCHPDFIVPCKALWDAVLLN